MPAQEKEKSLGAIWMNVSKTSGKKYLVIKVRDETYIGFHNDRRSKDTDPYYWLYEKLPAKPKSPHPNDVKNDEIPF